MKLREKRSARAEYDKQLKEYQEQLKELEEQRQDVNNPKWQFINASYNQLCMKIEKLKKDFKYMTGRSKRPDVVNFYRTAQPIGNMA